MLGFEELGDKKKYCEILTDLYRDAPKKISDLFKCTITVDAAEIEKSYDEYTAYIQYFAGLLDSGSPDHYKRAGSLLLALNGRDIVKAIDCSLDKSPIDIHDGCFLPIGLSHADKEHIYPYLTTFEKFPNPVMAFNICYRFMSLYETNVKNLFYSIEYYQVICTLLDKDKKVGKHEVISPDSAFLLFKSLAQ